MKKKSILVLVSALVFAGCSDDSGDHAAGSPMNSDAYKVEVEVPGEGSAADRVEIAVSVINALKDRNLTSLMRGDGVNPAAQLGSTGEYGLLVSVERSSFLLVFKSERVFVTCSVTGFDDNEGAGSVCRDVLVSEIEKQS